MSFDELFGSEGKAQVCRYCWGFHSFIIKIILGLCYMDGVVTGVRSKVTHFMYDDMCHLKVTN